MEEIKSWSEPNSIPKVRSRKEDGRERESLKLTKKVSLSERRMPVGSKGKDRETPIFRNCQTGIKDKLGKHPFDVI